MKVLLVNPSAQVHNPMVKTYATFPNGILYIASVLEKSGHEVRVLDCNIDNRTPSDFLEFGPEVIGLSVLTSPDLDSAISMSKEFKAVLPKTRIVWGGVHPSIMPEQTLTESYIDYVIMGAGEYTMRDLCHSLQNGSHNLKDIDGLAYRENGKIVVNRKRPFIQDLDELPDPAWHLVDVDKYWHITINTSRGCPFRCTYCYNTAFHKKYRAGFSADRIVSQIEYLKDQYNVRFFRFFEDNFTFDRERLRRFCQLLIDKKLKIKWDCDCRADLDDEDTALMAKSGCTSVALGIESGSQRLVKFLQKGETVKSMERSFWHFVKHKITPRINILYGLPTETIEDFNQTLNLLNRLDNPPYMFNHYVPYPGTTLFQYCVEKGLIDPPAKLGDWASFTTYYGTRGNLGEVPDIVLDQALENFRSDYAVRRFKFMMKHNPAYFMTIFTHPITFLSSLKSLIKHHLMMSTRLETKSCVPKEVGS